MRSMPSLRTLQRRATRQDPRYHGAVPTARKPQTPAHWILGPRKLGVDAKLYLRALRGARQRHGRLEGVSRLRRYLTDPRAIPRGGGNRYLTLGGRIFAIPALPPLDGPAFVEHLLDDMDALLDGGLAPLSLAMLCITPRCPHRCPYCYTARDRAEREVLSEELLVTTVRGMAAAGVRNLFLSGGEPMLRLDALPALLAAGEGMGMWLVSTGQGMKPRVMAKLTARGLRGVMISLDSLDATAHDAGKGRPGAFDEACEAIRSCRDAGLVVGINCIVGPALLERPALEAVITGLGDLGAHFVSLNSPHPVAGDDSLTPLPAASLRHVEAMIDATRRGRAWRRRPLAYSPDAWEALRGCVGGQEFFYVSPLGDVMACPFLRDTVGNVQEEPVGVLVERMRGARAGCQVCKNLQRAMGQEGGCESAAG